MNIRKYFKTFLVSLLFLTKVCYSDVIYVFVPNPGDFLTNLEFIGSFENSSRNNFLSLNFWAGGAVSFCMPEKYPGIGAEIAVEPRFYFFKNLKKNSLFISAYIGDVLESSPEFDRYGKYIRYVPTFGITPGFKTGYKRDICEWGPNTKSIFRSFVEPYFGISWPFYYAESEWSFFDFPLYSFGIRIGIEKNTSGITPPWRKKFNMEVQEVK